MLAKARNRRVISAFLLDGCHGLWCWCYACRRMDFVFRPQFGGKALALILLTLLFRDSSTVFGSDKYLNTPGGFFKTLGLLLWMVNDRIELDLINTHFGVCLKNLLTEIQQSNCSLFFCFTWEKCTKLMRMYIWHIATTLLLLSIYSNKQKEMTDGFCIWNHPSYFHPPA